MAGDSLQRQLRPDGACCPIKFPMADGPLLYLLLKVPGPCPTICRATSPDGRKAVLKCKVMKYFDSLILFLTIFHFLGQKTFFFAHDKGTERCSPHPLPVFCQENRTKPSDVGKRGGDCLCGLKAAGLRRKDKTEIVTCLYKACYNMIKTRAISYVETRRLRRNRETFTA